MTYNEALKFAAVPDHQVLRYSHTGFRQIIEGAVTPADYRTHRGVYADWIEEHEPQSVDPTSLDALRNHDGPVRIEHHDGKVTVSRVVTLNDLLSGNVHELYSARSRNSKGQAHKVRLSGKVKTWKTRPGEFRVPFKFGLYDNGEITHTNHREFLLDDPTRSHRPEKLSKRGLKLLFSRLRSHLETQTLMDGVGQAQKQWHQAEPGKPYPSDHLLAAANYYQKAGDPRAEIISHHADWMDGFHDQNPIHQHVASTAENRPLSSHTVPLPDGSHLFVQNHGHYEYPGVHAVTIRWTPKGGQHTYASHWHPDEARGLADRFGAADPEVGKRIHEALDRGEQKADRTPQKFGRDGEGDSNSGFTSYPSSASPESEPLKFAAYRAPAGGMVVRQSYYPGGSLVPDLQKEEYSATKKKPHKKHHLKKRLKKLFGGVAVGGFGNCCPDSGGGEGGGE